VAGDPKKPSSPFAALASLKGSLPAGEAPVAAASEKAPPVDRRFAGKLVVARSRKGRGGKTVTAVRGLAGSADELDAIARELKKALGCGATVEDGEVLVQGEQEKRVAAWLEAQGAKRVILGT
jgi:translation initiation factor 1